MSLFSFGSPQERIGAIIDIGSASVLVAIIASKDSSQTPTIIWSHREHAPLRNIDSIDQSAKAVMTALINALLKFDLEGRRALHEQYKRSRVDEVQCSVAAPWSYTVSKTVHYTQDEPFVITQNLIDELVRTATENITTELHGNETASQLGLKIIAETTMDILTNGYRVPNPEGQRANDLSVTHASVVVQKYLVDQLDDLRHKIFSATELHATSYMLMMHCVIQDIFERSYDACLVNVTYEATELGIVRDGSLQYTTHTPFGSFSLAREIAEITSVPLLEAFQYLHQENPYAFMEHVSEPQRNEIEKVFESYTEKLAALFHETGDDLSIPKNIFLHADLQSEVLFRDIVDKAARRQLKSEPNIRTITPQLVAALDIKETRARVDDTAMLASVQFFHKRKHCNAFKYL